MQFSVIYSVDIPRGVNMRPFVPPRCKELWQETEGDEQYECGYLEGDWENGHHRKWCAVLSEEEFAEFHESVGVYAESTRTMGSIGPGGWAPAVSFRNDNPEAIQSAYVTPCGSRSEIVEWLERHECEVPPLLTDSVDQTYLWPDAVADPWDAVHEAMVEVYGG